MRHLLLFDIDGTLLRCGRQVRRIFGTALEEVFGTAGDLDGYEFAGKIDPQIVLELLTAAGLEQAEIERGLPAMETRYLTRLAAELDAGQMVALAGARDALARLAADPTVTLGLLTGNWREGAYLKLGRLGLDRYFPLGAFGGDGAQREDLLPVALTRAHAATGHLFEVHQTVIIGDSVHDVACGLAHQVPVLAVSTGWTTGDRLVAAGATWVAESLDAGLAELALG